MKKMLLVNCGWANTCGIRTSKDACKLCNYYNKEKCEMDNTLLPAEVKLEAPTINLNQLQAKADERDVLLPAVFNRQTECLQKQDESDLLLPCGIGR